MKRHGSLFEGITSFPSLLAAARRSQRGKREAAPRFHDEVLRFNFRLEENLFRLQGELRSDAYRPARYRAFRIWEPKERLIAAPAYRDRVVHHALIEPIFDRTFIGDTYACRDGKGTLAALERFSRFALQTRFVLHLDVEKYFPTIDHEILKQLIRWKIRDRAVLRLCDNIIDSSPEGDPPVRYFPGDDLFTPIRRRRGLPIGSLTSQLFANLYLAPVDHLVNDELGWARYLRYMDDSCCFGDSKEELHRLAETIKRFLGDQLRLYVHPGKTLVSPVSEGMSFLGFRIYPARRKLLRRSSRSYGRRLGRLAEDYRNHIVDLDDVTRSVEGWVAHANWGNTYRLRGAVLGAVAFHRGERGV